MTNTDRNNEWEKLNVKYSRVFAKIFISINIHAIITLTLSLSCNIVQLLSLFKWGFEGVYKQQFIYETSTNHVSYYRTDIPLFDDVNNLP